MHQHNQCIKCLVSKIRIKIYNQVYLLCDSFNCVQLNDGWSISTTPGHHFCKKHTTNQTQSSMLRHRTIWLIYYTHKNTEHTCHLKFLRYLFSQFLICNVIEGAHDDNRTFKVGWNNKKASWDWNNRKYWRTLKGALTVRAYLFTKHILIPGLSFMQMDSVFKCKLM